MYRKCKIFLIGFMGSGKSTTGKKLASMLDWSFFDLDREIEEAAGMKIPEIFSAKGESYFRTIESESLRNLSSVGQAVISTGGGTPCFDGNMEFMLKTGLTVYLRLTPRQLKNRLAGSSKARPLIENIERDKLEDYITKKLNEREMWYAKAVITVDGYETDIPTLHTLVKKWIR
jgi:shikimate kinase